jgi:serine/threonine-protein kinase RsbW
LETKHYKLEIQSEPRHLADVERFVDMLAEEAQIDAQRTPGILLAVTEATTNAIIHGNKKCVEKKVVIEADICEDTLTIKVKDQGKGFDPAKIPDPTEPENLLKDSGRGLYLMRYHASELKYNITSDGTETILVISL